MIAVIFRHLLGIDVNIDVYDSTRCLLYFILNHHIVSDGLLLTGKIENLVTTIKFYCVFQWVAVRYTQCVLH